MGSLRTTAQTAVLIETLIEVRANTRWVSRNIFSAQGYAAAAAWPGRPESGGTIDNPRASRNLLNFS